MSATAPVVYQPLPPVTPAKQQRSLSPGPRSASRSEKLLRQTLTRDSRCHYTPPSTTTSSLGLTFTQQRRVPSTSIIDSDSESDDEPWLERVRSGSPQPRATRPTRATSPLPRLNRIQTSPPTGNPPLPKSHRRHVRTNSAQAALAIAIPTTRTASKPKALHDSPPTEFASLSKNTLYRADSAAKQRLEWALSKDRENLITSPTKRRPIENLSNAPLTRSFSVGHASTRKTPSLDSYSTDSSEHSPDPLTPPPSPPFNAQTALKLCKGIQGVVRFSDVEGLGAPPDLTDDEAHIRGPKDKSSTLLSSWLGGWSTRKEKDHSMRVASS